MAYLNVEEIESALESLAAAYPATTELIAVPHLTHEGRQAHVLRVGAAGPDQDSVLVLGGMHAREWVPPDAMIYLAADVLEAFDRGTGLVYGGMSYSAGDVSELMHAVNLLVYPCVNPDGRNFSQTADPQWRKNRRPSGGGCVGVDINRNFDFLWDHSARFAADSGVSASADPCDRNVYRGPSAASEAETRNVIWLLDSYPQIRWHMDVHSAVPVILHSWGSDQNQTAQPTQTFSNSAFDPVRGRKDDSDYGEYISRDDLDTITALSQRMDKAISQVRGVSYGYEQAYGLYPTSGASDDYAFSRHFADHAKTKVYGFTIECGGSFQPAWNEAEDIIREVCAGLIAFCLAVKDDSI